MAIDKALNRAPVGLAFDSSMPEEAPDLEIVIDLGEDEDEDEEELDAEEEEDDFAVNLAEDMDDDALAELASDLLGEFDEDISSRKDWIQTYVDGLELLGMKVEDRT